MFEYRTEMDKKFIIKNTISTSNISIPKLLIDLSVIKNNIVSPSGLTPISPISKKSK